MQVQHQPAPHPARSKNGSLMAILTLKGLHQVRWRNADGSETWHVYAWRGGPKLMSSPRRIEAASADLIAAFQAAHNKAPPPKAASRATLADLLAQWRASGEWARLSPNSRKDYLLQIDKVMTGVWDDGGGRKLPIPTLPQADLCDPRVRGVLLGWRDQALAHQPRTADKVMATLSACFGWAVNRGGLARNPLDGWKRLHHADRSLLIWTEADLAALKPHCSETLWQAVSLAGESGLAMGDLVALPWSAWDGSSIEWKRRKTGRDVLIPGHAGLRKLVETLPKRSTQMLANSRGRAWTASGLGHMFCDARDAAARDRAGVAGLRFHDLRGTAATRFLGAGLSFAQAAMVMGWDEKSVEQIAKKYVNRANIIAGMISKIDA